MCAAAGDFFGAGLSGIGVLPYLGDAAKLAKIPKWIKTVQKAAKVGKTSKAVRKIALPVFERALEGMKKIPKDKVPDAVWENIVKFKKALRKSIDELKQVAKNTTKRINLSKTQKARPGEKLSKVADKTPRELLAGKGGLSRLQKVPGGSDVDSTLADLVKRAKTDDIARRTLKELKKLVPKLGLD